MFTINNRSTKLFILLIGIIFLLMIPFSSAMAASQQQEGPPAFSLLEFLKTAGIIYTPLLLIVFGLVDYLGKLGVKGKAQLISSLLSGLILGGIVMYFTTYPNTAMAWFSVVLFGLLIGLGASGCYEGLKKATTSGSAASLGLPGETGKG